MNIRFDNEANMINENKMNQGVSAYNAGSMNVKESGMAKIFAGATFEKNDSINGMNVYSDKNSDKKDAAAAMNGIASVMNEASIQKDYMVVMSNTVSDEDYKKLQDNGFKIGSMTPKEAVNITDEIKATLAKAGTIIAGYNDDLDADTLKEITGSTAYANEIKHNTKIDNYPELEEAFRKYDLPMTDTNVNDAIATLNMAMELTGISDGAVKYMVTNDVKPSVENMYLANYSGAINNGAAKGYFMDSNGYLGKKSETVNDEAIKNQVNKIIENAGFEVNEETTKDAFKIIDEGMTFTEESFAKYEELKGIEFPLDKSDIANKIAMTIKDGMKAKDTDVTEGKTVLERAKELVDTANSISDEAIAKTVEAGKSVNLKNLAYAQRTIVVSASVTAVSMSSTARGYIQTMNEVRLSMTVSSTSFLLKNGIDVNTEDLSRLVDELKEAGNRQFESLFGKEYTVDQGALKELYDETTEKLGALRGMPLATVGLMSSRSAFSLNVLYEEGKTLQNRYISAGEKYEPLMTEVRGDLGDSIKKAFGNVPDILKEMNMEATAENERAVRILGYNNQSITEDSIATVKAVYEKVHNVITKMTPAKILELIRDGVNPLQTNIEELEKKLDMNPLTPVEEAERYSHFLYRMEKSGQITEDERESFIGIYRMINAIEKDDGAAIGTLIGTNGEINFRNLISAVRTRQNKGIDTTIDNNFGGLDKLTFKSATITDQIEKAFAGKESELSDNSDNIEMQYIKENADVLRENGAVKESVINFLVENEIAPTFDNIQSAKELTSNRGKIYKDITKLSEKSTKTNGNVNKNVENISSDSSINSENVEKAPDFTGDALDKILEAFTDKESCQTAMNEMAANSINFLSAESLREGSYIAVKDIVSSMKTMNVVKGLIGNECYEVPAYIDGELTSVRVSVQHKNNQIPNVSITLETEKLGKIGASFGITGDADTVEGFIVCDSDEGINRLRNSEDDFRTATGNMPDMKVGNINYFKSSNTDVNYFSNKTDNNISKGLSDKALSKSLYNVSKEFIKIFSAK